MKSENAQHGGEVNQEKPTGMWECFNCNHTWRISMTSGTGPIACPECYSPKIKKVEE